MPPKRKAAPKKKEESPPPSESEPESEEELSSEEEPESPKPKKAKAPAKPKALPKPKVASSPPGKKPKAAPKPKKETAKKGAKLEVAVDKPAPLPTPEKKPAPTPEKKTAPTPQKKTAPKGASKQVFIEHCKQCQSFKRTAAKLEGLLKKAIPDLEVTTNPEKPRKGVFEVRDGDGNVFVSLTDLVRPFKKMKDLNLEETADDVVSKLA